MLSEISFEDYELFYEGDLVKAFRCPKGRWCLEGSDFEDYVPVCPCELQYRLYQWLVSLQDERPRTCSFLEGFLTSLGYL